MELNLKIKKHSMLRKEGLLGPLVLITGNPHQIEAQLALQAKLLLNETTFVKIHEAEITNDQLMLKDACHVRGEFGLKTNCIERVHRLLPEAFPVAVVSPQVAFQMKGVDPNKVKVIFIGKNESTSSNPICPIFENNLRYAQFYCDAFDKAIPAAEYENQFQTIVEYIRSGKTEFSSGY